jgi:hypothetical protein
MKANNRAMILISGILSPLALPVGFFAGTTPGRQGSVWASIEALFRKIVYCVGPERGGPVCGHNAMLKLADLPDWEWPDLKCSRCGAVGYVDTRLNWSEVINFDKGIC